MCIRSFFFSVFTKNNKNIRERNSNCFSVVFVFRFFFFFFQNPSKIDLFTWCAVWRASEQFALGEKESRHHYHHSPSSSFLSTMLCVCWMATSQKCRTPIFRTGKTLFCRLVVKRTNCFHPSGIYYFSFFFSSSSSSYFYVEKRKFPYGFLFVVVVLYFSCCPSRFNDRTK